jgi:hypothetical protein
MVVTHQVVLIMVDGVVMTMVVMGIMKQQCEQLIFVLLVMVVIRAQDDDDDDLGVEMMATR